MHWEREPWWEREHRTGRGYLTLHPPSQRCLQGSREIGRCLKLQNLFATIPFKSERRAIKLYRLKSCEVQRFEISPPLYSFVLPKAGKVTSRWQGHGALKCPLLYPVLVHARSQQFEISPPLYSFVLPKAGKVTSRWRGHGALKCPLLYQVL